MTREEFEKGLRNNAREAISKGQGLVEIDEATPCVFCEKESKRRLDTLFVTATVCPSCEKVLRYEE